MATSTVENYLKNLYLAQQADPQGALVPTGRIATAMDVTPGTATTMIKALAESGLVEYEPHSGARLTPRGQRLALHVLRRHRLLELFLVQTLGLDWSEVHDEAEVLEHAISDKVLDRIDRLLGRPTVDPHGDPIPTATGRVPHRELAGLNEFQPGQLVHIARIANQDPAFLRFADERGLRPRTILTILGVDPLADSVSIRNEDGADITIGTAAAKQILSAVVQSGRDQVRE